MTSIKAAWLAAADCPLRDVSAVLDVPAPSYDASADRQPWSLSPRRSAPVLHALAEMCTWSPWLQMGSLVSMSVDPVSWRCRLVQWHDVSYGQHGWELPRLAQPLQAPPEARAAVFLSALLRGNVLPCMAGGRTCSTGLASECRMRCCAQVCSSDLTGAPGMQAWQATLLWQLIWSGAYSKGTSTPRCWCRLRLQPASPPGRAWQQPGRPTRSCYAASCSAA